MKYHQLLPLLLAGALTQSSWPRLMSSFVRVPFKGEPVGAVNYALGIETTITELVGHHLQRELRVV